MNASDEVVLSREAKLKAVFLQHSAYLDSRWSGDEHFAAQARMPKPGPRWRKEPPASFLVMLLRDPELRKYEVPPFSHLILANLDDTKFRAIVEWLHAVLLEAATQKERKRSQGGTRHEGCSYLQYPESCWIRNSFESEEDFSYMARQRSSLDTNFDTTVEDRIEEIGNTLLPVSGFLRKWVRRVSCPYEIEPASWQSIPLPMLLRKLLSAQEEPWYPYSPPLLNLLPNFVSAISDDQQYQQLIAWLKAVAISITKTIEIKRSRRRAIDGSLPATPITPTFSGLSYGSSVPDRASPSASSEGSVQSFRNFVATTPPIPGHFPKANSQRSNGSGANSASHNDDSAVGRCSGKSGAPVSRLTLVTEIPREMKGQQDLFQHSPGDGNRSRWSAWSDPEDDGSGFGTSVGEQSGYTTL